MLKPNRNWVILRLEPGTNNVWRQFTASYAPTRKAAIDMATAFGPYSEGSFKAIPAKAWGKTVDKP